jgi:hypothetical protein
MAKDIMGYARQNVARARYARQPSTTPQRRATIDPTLFSGKKAATGAPLASRPIEGGPALPSPQEYNPIIDAESGEDPNAPRVETQQPIENRGSSARYMLQTGGPRLDLSFLVPERANKAFDPSKAIGGENVPYQESTGVGGFFRRLLGDESNRMNIEAQQAQGAEWRAEAAEQKKEERLLNRMQEADKPTQARFEATQRAAEKAEANRVTAENKRLELEGERLGLTKQQIEEARLDRIERLKGEQADREARIEDMRNRNALADAAFGRSMLPSAQAISTGQGGVLMYDPRSGQPIGTFSSPTIGEIINPQTGEKSFGPTGGGYEPYIPPVTVPKDLPDSPQVDRTTGAAPGGPRKDTMGGKLPPPEVTPMRAAAAPSPVADASLLGRFREAMPSLGFNQPSARGYTAPEMTEGDVAQQAMSQIAYPLRAAAAEEFKGEYENPDVAARVMAGAPPFPRFRKPSATEMSQARKAGSLIRQMYAE